MTTGIRSLDSSLQTTLDWLSEIQEELGWTDREKVYKATKAVLHGIRDRSPIEEVINFTANLPVVMKGMLFDGYNLSGKPIKIKSIGEFYDYIQTQYGGGQGNTINADDACRGVINIISDKVGEGEMRKLTANMPVELRPLFQFRTPDMAAHPSQHGTRRKLEIPIA